MTAAQPNFRNIIEAALFSAEAPLTVKQLQMLFAKSSRPSQGEILRIIEALIADYTERGIELVCASGGYRFQTRATYADWLRRLSEFRPPRYSKALLETLAIIAYRQPVTRGDIEEIRGVTVTTEIMRALLDREWVRNVGARDVPGHPALYCTTPGFLEYFGLVSLESLPKLEDPRQIGEIVQELNFDLSLEGEGGDKIPGLVPEQEYFHGDDLVTIDLNVGHEVVSEESKTDNQAKEHTISVSGVAESDMPKVVAPSGE